VWACEEDERGEGKYRLVRRWREGRVTRVSVCEEVEKGEGVGL